LAENIFEKIKEEHEEFKEMLQTMESGGKSSEDTFEEFKKELEAHNKAEERTLYESLKGNKKAHEMALVGIEEHRMGSGVVNKLDRQESKSGEEWRVQVNLLKHMLEKHIEVEEQEVIPAAQDMLSKKAVDELSEAFESIEERIEQGK
jgi:hemerythrin-like domain-containing protein